MSQDFLYSAYEDWKGWKEFFSYSPEQAEYFSGETCGIDFEGKVLLEMGFGAGSFLAWAGERGAELYGTEINKKALEAARRHKITLLDPNIETIASDHSDQFDVIVAFDLFEHFSIQDVIIRTQAANTMLKPGGYFILRFPNGQSPLGRVPQHGDITHITSLSRDKFEQICQGTTLKPIRYRGSYRVRGRNPLKILIRLTRYILSDLITKIVNTIYGINPPWDPTVVLVLRKNHKTANDIEWVRV